MKYYETLMLVRTDATSEKMQILEKSVEEALKKAEGKMLRFEKWGKYKLAYPVNKQGYGIYFLARYELPNEQVNAFFKNFDINIKVRYSDFLMRHVNVLLTKQQAEADYKRPLPIDENESISKDRRIMAMSNQTIGFECDELDDGVACGEVLDVSKLSVDTEEEGYSAN